MTLFKILLTAHIILGSSSLLLGLFVLFAQKGNKRHKQIGSIYYYIMLTTALLALIMSYMHLSYFLFIIGVFTTYMLLTGKRYLHHQLLSEVKLIDWILTVAMLLFGLAFIAFGGYKMIQANNFGLVLIAFGAFSLLFVGQDYINFKGKSTVKNFWLLTHLQRMIGSYIAAVTAFLVVNNSLLPGLIAWLLPTFLLVPLIIKWSRKYEVKKDRAK